MRQSKVIMRILRRTSIKDSARRSRTCNTVAEKATGSRADGATGRLERRLMTAALLLLATSVCIHNVSAKSSHDWEKTLRKGNNELQIGNTDKAVKFFKRKVSRYPRSGACHTALGRALKRKGELSRAKQEFRQATAVEPQYGPGFYELGAICESDREWGEAQRAFTRYLQLCPDAGKRKTVEDRIRFCKNKQ